MVKPIWTFPDAQWQLTPQSMVGYGRISNNIEILWLFALPARMKKIQPKMKALEWPQHLSHYKYVGFFPDAQGQLTSVVGCGRISNSSMSLGRKRNKTRK